MTLGAELESRLRAAVRDVPDHPSPGILFKDITPLLADGPLLAETVQALAARYPGARSSAASAASGESAASSGGSVGGVTVGGSTAGRSEVGGSMVGGATVAGSEVGGSVGGVTVGDATAGRIDVVAGIEARGFIFGAPLALALGVGFVPIRKSGKLPHTTVSAEYALEYATASIEVHTDAVTPGQRVLVVDDVLATGGTAEAAARLMEGVGATVVALAFVLELGDLGGRARLSGREVRSLVRY